MSVSADIRLALDAFGFLAMALAENSVRLGLLVPGSIVAARRTAGGP